MVEDIRELTEEDFARAIPRKQRERIISGRIDPGKDITALRRFVGLTQEEFAAALGISVHTLRNWEQRRRRPEGPAPLCCALPPGTRGCCGKTSSLQRKRFRGAGGPGRRQFP